MPSFEIYIQRRMNGLNGIMGERGIDRSFQQVLCGGVDRPRFRDAWAAAEGMPRLRPEQVGAEEPHFPQSHRDAGTPGSRSSQPFRVVIGAVEIVSGFVLLEFSFGGGGRGLGQQRGHLNFIHRFEAACGIESLMENLH